MSGESEYSLSTVSTRFQMAFSRASSSSSTSSSSESSGTGTAGCLGAAAFLIQAAFLWSDAACSRTSRDARASRTRCMISTSGTTTSIEPRAACRVSMPRLAEREQRPQSALCWRE
eukprot:scaffold59035_cov63-Phaeocystis_antarctica.AAC.4